MMTVCRRTHIHLDSRNLPYAPARQGRQFIPIQHLRRNYYLHCVGATGVQNYVSLTVMCGAVPEILG